MNFVLMVVMDLILIAFGFLLGWSHCSYMMQDTLQELQERVEKFLEKYEAQ